MGKLLLIFDGFDEMADRTNRQKQIDNFWQLARAVGPNSKAILTCRSEHFEFAKAASKTFRGEGAPTFSPEPLALLEPPRFEILSLAKLSPVQVEEIVVKREGASRGTTLARKIQDVPALADLAGRAVAIELIIAALPSLDEAKVDLARVFLYATRELLVRNIREKRSFTSMADKVHFLCELAWQMLSTGELKLHFTQFPDHIRQYRPELKDREIDHWKFDLGGQTLIVRDDDGNYSFSHKALPEFFVAYKFAAELGIFSAGSEWIQSYFPFGEYTGELPARSWHDFFRCPNQDEVCRHRDLEKDGTTSCRAIGGSCIKYFIQESDERIAASFGRQVLSRDISRFLEVMVENKEPLWTLIRGTKGKATEQVAFSGGNAITLLQKIHETFGKRRLQKVVIPGSDFTNADLTGIDLSGADLRGSRLSGALLEQSNFEDSDLRDISIDEISSVSVICWSPDGRKLVAVGSDNKLHLWSTSSSPIEGRFGLKSLSIGKVNDLCWDPSGNNIYVASDGNVQSIDFGNSQASSDLGIKGVTTGLSIDSKGRVLALRRSFKREYQSPLREVVLFEIPDKKENILVSVTGIFNYPTVLRFAPTPLSAGNDLLYVGKYTGNIQIFDIVCGSRTGKVVFLDPKLQPSGPAFPTEYNGKVLQIEFLPRSRRFAILDSAGRLNVWTRNDLTLVDLSSKTGRWTSICVHPTDDLLGAAMGSTIHIFDLRASSPTFGLPVVRLGQPLRCNGMRIARARGLDALGPSGKGTLGQWLQERGALSAERQKRAPSA